MVTVTPDLGRNPSESFRKSRSQYGHRGQGLLAPPPLARLGRGFARLLLMQPNMSKIKGLRASPFLYDRISFGQSALCLTTAVQIGQSIRPLCDRIPPLYDRGSCSLTEAIRYQRGQKNPRQGEKVLDFFNH